jgi:hypothetical protein
VEDFGDGVPGDEREIVGPVDIDPRVGIPRRVVELAEIDGDIELPIVQAQVGVVVGDGRFMKHFAGQIGLHERRREAPVDRFAIGTDALQVMRIGPLARGTAKLGCRQQRRNRGGHNDGRAEESRDGE